MELNNEYKDVKIKDFKDIFEHQIILERFMQERYSTVIDTKHKKYRIVNTICEIGEFCECKEEHKTWKKNKNNEEEKELEEYIDILHFTVSLYFYKTVDENKKVNYVEMLTKFGNITKQYYENEIQEKEDTTLAVYDFCSDLIKDSEDMIISLLQIAKLKGYSYEDLVKAYEKKWKKNIERQLYMDY